MKKIKHFNLAKILLTSCIIFAIVSCEKEQEVIVLNNSDDTESVKLATFKFSNGNTLELLQEIETGEPAVLSIESSAIGNETFINYDKNSMLDVYLALTPDNYPVPKVLIDIAKSDEKIKMKNHRQVVEKLDDPVLLNIREIPANLLEPVSIKKMQGVQKNERVQAYCDNVSADFCTDWRSDKSHTWSSSSNKKKIETQTSVSAGSSYGMKVTHKYKWAGKWRKSASKTVNIGETKRFITIGGVWLKRRSVRESHGNATIWRGWTDVRN